jgi:hypothetical protein
MDDKKLKLMSWSVKLPSTYFTGLLMVSHPPVEGGCEFGWGKPYAIKDDHLLRSLCDYFEERMKKEQLEKGSLVWDSIYHTHTEFIELLRDRDYDMLHEYLRSMYSKPVTHGIAQGDFFYKNLIENKDDIRKNTEFAIYDKFLSLLEAVGTIPAFSPEEYQTNNNFLKYYAVDIDQYFDMLEDHFDCKIVAPAFQGNHFGIQTKRHGVFSDRDIMSLGTAIRIMETYWSKKDITIAEIGAGLGHLTYYLNIFGFKNFTHIEMPTIAVAAKYFIETNMPKVEVQHISQQEFDGDYDLVINIDGLSTFSKDVAVDYLSKTSKNANHFFSVNREFDEFRVFDLCDMRRISRNPFWYRRGYIEEDYVQGKRN